MIKIQTDMKVENMRSGEGRQLFEMLLHPGNLQRIDNIGPDNYVLVNDRKSIDTRQKKLVIGIFAPAGDDGDIIEPLSGLEPESRKFGRLLGEKINSLDEDIQVIVQTGGCEHVGDWVTQELRRISQRTTLIALYPRPIGKIPTLESRPKHIQQYHYVLYPDMDVYMRCLLVGTADIGFSLHGGDGTLVESGFCVGQEGILGIFNPKNTMRGIAKGLAENLKYSYKRKGCVFFRNSSVEPLVERAFVEYYANQRNLWGKLSAVVIYRHKHENEKDKTRDCLLINFRKCELPVTYYHRGKEHEPLEQVIVADISPEELLSIFKEYNGIDEELEPVKPIERYERPNMFKLSLNHFGTDYIGGSAAAWMQMFRDVLQRQYTDKLFYHRFFEDNPR